MLYAVHSLETYVVYGLVSSVGKLFVEDADNISWIVCERGFSNNPVDQLPSVLPHELYRM